MKRIFIFIFSCFWMQLAWAQESAKPIKDSLPVLKMCVPAGVTIGLDLSRIPVRIFQPYRTDVMVKVDARYNEKIYFASELTFNTSKHQSQKYDYKGNGLGLALGFNYNFLKKYRPGDQFLIYGGLRYGIGLVQYEYSRFQMENGVWDPVNGSFPKSNSVAHWVGVTLGMRVEVLKNVQLGWALHQRVLMNSKIASQDAPPIIIPGFGKGYKKSAFDFEYTVSYTIPLWKVKQSIRN
jgi:hypothetical protein